MLEQDKNQETQAVEAAKKGSFPSLLIGTAIGAALGLLLAPQTGETTREQIGDWIKEKRRSFGGMKHAKVSPRLHVNHRHSARKTVAA